MALEPGDAVPHFSAQALNGHPNYCFDSAAGRPLLLLFMGSGTWAPSIDALALIARHNQIFDDERASFFGITIDLGDAAAGRIAQRRPGIRWFLDYDAKVSRLYEAAAAEERAIRYQPFWLLLDSGLRIVQRAAIADGAAIFAALEAMIARGPEQSHAPVLVVPRVFEPEACRALIAMYDKNGGQESGVMRQENGMTVHKLDHGFKRRSDYEIVDEAVRSALLRRMRRRLMPQIAKSFQFEVTRIERWIVACYDGESGGFFRAHRDNTTAGTAHRKFACTINLNAEDYDGGELRFPEFGNRTYRAPTGGAVIFSCSLLHEATPVTRGKRYAFLPFLYDEAGARLRQQNLSMLAPQPGGPEVEAATTSAQPEADALPPAVQPIDS